MLRIPLDDNETFGGNYILALFKMSWLYTHVPCKAVVDLPWSLSHTDRRKVQVLVSNLRGGVDTGRVQTLVRYCPEHFLGDSYVPPNLCFQNCYLINNTVPLTLGGPSIKSLKGGEDPTKSNGRRFIVVNGVEVWENEIKHVKARHTLKPSHTPEFMSDRMSEQFVKLHPITGVKGNSVFICQTMVLALIKATIMAPDKVTEANGGRVSHEKCFKTEIGHSVDGGCCHVVKVVTEYKNAQGATQKLVTAYPVSSFSPSQN